MAECAYGQDVHYNYDRSANFAAYKTYQWVEIPGGSVPDRLIDRAIKQATDEQLAQKGLTRVEENPDVYIGYQVVINLEKSVDLYSTGIGPGGWGGWGDRSVHGQTSTVPVGILLMDVYDVSKKQLVWRGDASRPSISRKTRTKTTRTCKKLWRSFLGTIRLSQASRERGPTSVLSSQS
jgi:hypothetical protein